MAAPAIILGKGQVLITNSASVLGLISLDNKVQFGVVAAINDLSDRFTVNDAVIYEPTKIIDRLLYGSTIYILINEDGITGTETDIP